MPKKSPSVSEIIRSLPTRLQSRFYAVGNYVRGVLEALDQEEGRKTALGRDSLGYIQLAVFIYFLDSFLREGTRAAEAAVVGFEQFGLSGFSIGSTAFTRDSENTYLGRNLAEGLLAVLDGTTLEKRIQNAPNSYTLIKTLRSELIRG